MTSVGDTLRKAESIPAGEIESCAGCMAFIRSRSGDDRRRRRLTLRQRVTVIHLLVHKNESMQGYLRGER